MMVWEADGLLGELSEDFPEAHAVGRAHAEVFGGDGDICGEFDGTAGGIEAVLDRALKLGQQGYKNTQVADGPVTLEVSNPVCLEDVSPTILRFDSSKFLYVRPNISHAEQTNLSQMSSKYLEVQNFLLSFATDFI